MKNTALIVFKVIKSSWGIHIQIKATAVEISASPVVGSEAIGGNVFLKLNSSVKLSSEEYDMFVQGIRSYASSGCIDKPTLLTIDEIFFIDSDFQIEGLYWAARMLMSDLTENEFEWPRIEFDKTSNRYAFLGN